MVSKLPEKLDICTVPKPFVVRTIPVPALMFGLILNVVPLATPMVLDVARVIALDNHPGLVPRAYNAPEVPL
jgi:hypothetical protein